jgi:hypothetical protein
MLGGEAYLARVFNAYRSATALLVEVIREVAFHYSPRACAEWRCG